MKLKVQQVNDATLVLAKIINEKRPMPNKGHYLVARVHAKLTPEFNVIIARYDDMIKAYDTPQYKTETNPETGEAIIVPVEGQWRVPDDKLSEFHAAWKVVGAEEIEVDVQPIPLSCLSLGDECAGPISAAEFITLGELVFDSAGLIPQTLI